MLTLKSSAHIPTSRLIKSFRSCQSSTSLSLRHLEAGRIGQERIRLADRRQRRIWLERQWSEHLKRKAGSGEDSRRNSGPRWRTPTAHGLVRYGVSEERASARAGRVRPEKRKRSGRLSKAEVRSK